MGLLRLEIVTPRGGFLREERVEQVVLRRAEAVEPGSEVAILPSHGPLLMRVADCEVRFRKAGAMRRLAVHGGFAEVRGDVVTVLTPKAERPAS